MCGRSGKSERGKTREARGRRTEEVREKGPGQKWAGEEGTSRKKNGEDVKGRIKSRARGTGGEGRDRRRGLAQSQERDGSGGLATPSASTTWRRLGWSGEWGGEGALCHIMSSRAGASGLVL